MKYSRRTSERGASLGIMFGFMGLILVVVLLSGLTVWMYIQYHDASTNLEGKQQLAANEATKKQADSDAKQFAEKEKQPYKEFAAPANYGSVSFLYPKTWSVYIDQPGGEGQDFAAYLNPGAVPSINNNGNQPPRFAAQVLIQNTTFSDTLNDYQGQIQSGELTSSVVKINGESATRLDGAFNDNLRGAAVIFTVRDKTVTISTDANTFLPDFNNIVQSIKFNK